MGLCVSDVGILILDDDIVSQRALKNVLDTEGWQLRIVTAASQALPELATGKWDLAIANFALVDENGSAYAVLRELAQVDQSPQETEHRAFRVLFLVGAGEAQRAIPILEEEGLPYLLRPYHLHDFLEKVSELLVETGAIGESMRGVGDFSRARKRKRSRTNARDSRRDAMFASRDDYHMTEEEMAEFERQEAEDRKKREKDSKDRDHY